MARKMSTQPTAHAAKIFMGPSTHTDNVLPYLLAAQPGIAAPETHKPSTQRTKRKKPGRFLSRKNFACPSKNEQAARNSPESQAACIRVRRTEFIPFLHSRNPGTPERGTLERNEFRSTAWLFLLWQFRRVAVVDAQPRIGHGEDEGPIRRRITCVFAALGDHPALERE